MTTRVDTEDIETTKSEKLLAVVLAVFLLIGGLWAYEKIDDYVGEAIAVEASPEPEAQAAFERRAEARTRLARAQEERARAREDLELSREAYRTALEAGEPTARLEREYRRAQARLETATADLEAAREAVRAAEPAARAAERETFREAEEREDRRALVSFLLRLAFVTGLVAFGYWLLARLRTRSPRYFPLGLAFVGFAAVLAFVFAGDYITDYVDPLDLGPLVLSLFGIAVTVVAFAALQRYLARRLPYRRVRKRECPFCGYPVRDNARCEGCGREVIAECATCGNERRVGTLHCGACGAA